MSVSLKTDAREIRNLQPFPFNGHTLTALILFIENTEHASLEPALAAAVSEAATPRILEGISARLRDLAALFVGEKYLYYSHYPNWNDAWDINLYRKRIQIGDSPGERIQTAIADSAEDAPEAILWLDGRSAGIGADDLQKATALINMYDLVIGTDPTGKIALLGFGPEAFGLALPEELNPDVMAEAAAAAGLSTARTELPAPPQSVEDLLRLQITVE
jgi:hypothetical protein